MLYWQGFYALETSNAPKSGLFNSFLPFLLVIVGFFLSLGESAGNHDRGVNLNDAAGEGKCKPVGAAGIGVEKEEYGNGKEQCAPKLYAAQSFNSEIVALVGGEQSADKH